MPQVPIHGKLMEPIFIRKGTMAKQVSAAPFMPFTLDPTSDVPLYRQLYIEMRDAILSGHLTAGYRLPSTRLMADQLQLSRNTVMNAFEQLLAEGYLEGRVGDGTYVSHTLPEDLLHVHGDSHDKPPQELPSQRRLSRQGMVLKTRHTTMAHDRREVRAFRQGLPALDEFPFKLWSQLAANRWKTPDAAILGYGTAAGYQPLREVIADYLRAARSVRCTADQVIVVGGAQQALDLAARVLIDPNDPVWIEDPGYLGARGALISAGAELIPVPIDNEGLDIQAGLGRHDTPRVVYVSPSHQFPLGVTMSLARRLALLEWASRVNAWILEDDYDSEFRYASRPLAALQGLDQEDRVIYFGTFSKVMFPALRLGYMVVPDDLLDVFIAARALSDRHSSTLLQAVLTDFIAEGHFVRHIRRMRALYAERQSAVVQAIGRELGGLLDVSPAEAGMHLVGWLPEGVNDAQAAALALDHGVETRALSEYLLHEKMRPGLLLGYAAVGEAEIFAGAKRLARALSHLV
jgi:GntR family transcriptional regulator / MocR family aminotransferase